MGIGGSQTLRGHPQLKESDQDNVRKLLTYHSASLESSCRSTHRNGKRNELAEVLQPFQKIHVLQKREAGKSAHARKHLSANEKSLVAKMEKAPPEPREPGISVQHRMPDVELQSEASSRHAAIRQRPPDVKVKPPWQ